ncbi:MAG: PH domain-containing protein, partial [Solirubrobacteraceae bacterium]|nr:PH domain-containing protein [Solirubrobacteraceae bacterium]
VVRAATPPPPANDDAPAPLPPEADERRLHPAATVIEAIRHVRSAVAGMIVLIVSVGFVYGALIVVGLLVVMAVFAFLEWRTTTYAVVDGTLRHRSGVFSRREQNIPGSRISALDTSRGLLQRLFGVVAVNVQTAGGGKAAEISLRAVTFQEAERLRHALGHRASAAAEAAAPRATDDAAPTDGSAAATTSPTFTKSGTALPTSTGFATIDDPAPVVYSMTPRELVIAALTSPSTAFVGAAAAAAISLGNDALPDRVQNQLADRVDELTVTAAIIVVVLGLLVAALVSVGGTIVMYGGFRVTRDERRLRVRRGIFTERTGTIPRDRIHGVRIIESPLRQWLGYAAIEVEVAGYAGQDEVMRTLIPLIRREEIPALLRDVVPGIVWPEAPLRRVPTRARRRYLTVPLLTAAVPAVALAVAPLGAFRLLAVIPRLLALLAGLLEARAAGWALADDTLTLRWRSFARTTLLANAKRLQRTEMTASPFQRRANLGTFQVRLSSGRGGRIRHLEETEVSGLLRTAGR